MTVRILLIAAGISALMLGCIEDEGEGSHRTAGTGTIVYATIEGGFFGIVDDRGGHWDPTNLPEDFRVDSLRVRFDAVITDEPTAHMWGRTVLLMTIERLE